MNGDVSTEKPELTPEQQEINKRRSRRTLLMIVGIALLPVVLAYTMFFTGMGVPDNTVNKGELIKAVNVSELLSSDDWTSLGEDKKWRLLLPLGKQCDERCQENFYTTRQVHIRLGEKGVRVERFAVNYGGAAGDDYLAEIKPEHPLLRTFNVDESVWRAWQEQLGEMVEAPHYYLLVDQEGYAMMRYTDQHGNDLLKDIKRALKFSIDYQ